MTRYDLSPLFSSTVGFDRFARLLDSLPDTLETVHTYPPYNIEADGEDRYRISMAVAGFTEDMLNIEVKENLLSVSGESQETNTESKYLYRGIAGRDFVRKFQLDDHVKVTGANLANGLLTIDLLREVPEEMKPRTIEIKNSVPKTLLGKAKKLIEGDSSKAA
ncbi:MAG: Hsp20 family protein [Rhodospirillaceae bacterium]|nr:Hsp20 family protein [Rhodospirillaceae bacterium]MBL6931184.1 Hsp20 family protein [Rhodospirillales bacterium]